MLQRERRTFLSTAIIEGVVRCRDEPAEARSAVYTVHPRHTSLRF